jgi:IS5 family transposase
MRQERTVQATVFDIFAEHEIGRELSAISQWLDEQRWLLGLIAADLRGHGIKQRDVTVCRRKRFCAVRFSSSIDN